MAGILQVRMTDAAVRAMEKLESTCVKINTFDMQVGGITSFQHVASTFARIAPCIDFTTIGLEVQKSALVVIPIFSCHIQAGQSLQHVIVVMPVFTFKHIGKPTIRAEFFCHIRNVATVFKTFVIEKLCLTRLMTCHITGIILP